MNYIVLLNHFWVIQKEVELHATEIALYLLLLDSCNRTNWRNTFTHSNLYLCGRLHITERTLIKARQKLIDLKLIKVISGKSKHTLCQYSLIDNQEGDVFERTIVLEQNANAVEEDLGSDSPVNFLSNRYKKKLPIDAKEQDIVKQKTKNERKKNKEIYKEKFLNKENQGNDFCKNQDSSLIEVQAIFEKYNEACTPQKKVSFLGNKRKRNIQLCLTEFGFERISQMLEKFAISNYLHGKNNYGWIPGIDWVFKIENCARIMEGDFDHNNKTDFDPFSKPSPIVEVASAYDSILETDKDFIE